MGGITLVSNPHLLIDHTPYGGFSSDILLYFCNATQENIEITTFENVKT
jgi:hypothetical protein